MPEKPKIKCAPHSKESEMIVLGCMLTSVDGLNSASDRLVEGDFYYTEHRPIFAALYQAYKGEKPADIHLIAEELKRQGKLEEVGGVAYLMQLAQYAGVSVYVEEYAELVRDKSILRRMITAAQSIEKRALDEPKNVNEALDDAQALFFAISQSSNQSIGVLLRDMLSGLKADSGLPYLKELQERQQNYLEKGEAELAITGVPTHFYDLDVMINGLNNSNLIILAARPAMGKTALGLNIAENLCFKSNLAVGFFSLEMSADQLLHRMICSQSDVESEKILSGNLDGSDYQKIVSAVNVMQKHTMLIDDQPGLRINDLRARARRMKEVFDVRLIVIDYLQLLGGSNTYGNHENRQTEISEISRNLKHLARELDIPILCLAQLSRKVEERQGHRPIMSDLRESGSIEQDADVVMFLLRQEYYSPNAQPGMANLIVGKNRHGKTGEVSLVYRKEVAQFGNYSVAASTDEGSSAFSAFSPTAN